MESIEKTNQDPNERPLKATNEFKERIRLARIERMNRVYEEIKIKSKEK